MLSFAASVSLTFSIILFFGRLLEYFLQTERFPSFVFRVAVVYVGAAMIIRLVVESIVLLRFVDAPYFSVLSFSGFLLSAVATAMLVTTAHFVRGFSETSRWVLLMAPPPIFALAIGYVYFYSPKQFFNSPLSSVPIQFFAYGLITAIFLGLLAVHLREKGFPLHPIAYFTMTASVVTALLSIWFFTSNIFDTPPAVDWFDAVSSVYFAHSAIAVTGFGILPRTRTRSFAKGDSIVRTGIKVLDGYLSKGLPYPGSFVVMGSAGSGRTTLLVMIACKRLSEGDGVFFFSIDQPASQLKKLIAERCAEFQKASEQGRLFIVEIDSGGKSSIKLDPQEINLAFTEYVHKLGGLKKWVFIDSFTTLLNEFGEEKGIKLLRTLVQKTQQMHVGLFISYNPYAMPRNTTAIVEDTANGVIEIIVEEKKQKRQRKLRIKWMTGYRPLGEWTPVEDIV
ncbi:MAG: RAD55 family ATPase [Candidatus Caldarchaeum sp.]|nr:RAD55 family ATPase [Candidatus Caldarchaeum sp.]MDW8434834.1 RAD55 family ATPase [Candidatus Caldarchaeum sp.]